ADEPHRVEGPTIARSSGQLVYGHDPGMLELPGDLRLLKKACRQHRIGRPLGLKLLERDVAAEVAVERQPDLGEAALGVKLCQRVAIAALGRAGDGRIEPHNVVILGREADERLADLEVLDRGDRPAGAGIRSAQEAGVDVATVLAELSLEQELDM